MTKWARVGSEKDCFDTQLSEGCLMVYRRNGCWWMAFNAMSGNSMRLAATTADGARDEALAAVEEWRQAMIAAPATPGEG